MSATSFYGSWLALGLAAAAVALVGWQLAERRHRGASPSEADRDHFRGQDARRRVVAGSVSLLAAGVYLGSRIPYRREGRPNLAFLQTWLAVFLLIMLLLVLALLDWLATRRYARRHRDAIVREGMEILRDKMRARRPEGERPGLSGGRNGFDPGEIRDGG